MRLVRGSLGEAVAQLQSESDLLLLASARPLPKRGAAVSQRARRQPLVAVLGDGDEAGQRASEVAAQLAQALSGVLEVLPIARHASLLDQPERLPALARCDVLVLPHMTLDVGALAQLRCPILLVV